MVRTVVRPGSERSGNLKHDIIYARIDAGTETDLLSLFEDFVRLDDLRFTAFAERFAHREFGLIYCGLTSPEELAEFSQCLLRNAVEYIFPKELYPDNAEIWRQKENQNHSFMHQIFGIYVLLSLYSLQASHFVRSVDVTVVELQFLDMLITELTANGYLDAAFCLFRLLAQNAFGVVYSVFEFDVNLYKMRKVVLEALKPVPHDVITPGGMTRVAALQRDPLMNRMEIMHDYYEELKRGVLNSGMCPRTASNNLDRLNMELEIKNKQIDEAHEKEKQEKKQKEANKKKDFEDCFGEFNQKSINRAIGKYKHLFEQPKKKKRSRPYRSPREINMESDAEENDDVINELVELGLPLDEFESILDEANKNTRRKRKRNRGEREIEERENPSETGTASDDDEMIAQIMQEQEAVDSAEADVDSFMESVLNGSDS